MALDDLCDQAVLYRAATWGNANGRREASYDEAPLAAAVQPMAASRVHRLGLEAGETGYRVYIPFDAFAAAVPGGGRPGDLVLWRGKTLAVQGPAEDQAGRGEVVGLDCKELR